MRLSILFATALTIALVCAAPASAASVCNQGGVATFAAADTTRCGGAPGASETNALTVSVNGAGAIVFTDPNNPVSDADGPGGCTASGNTGTCPGTIAMLFDLGDGNDSAAVGAVASDVTPSTGGGGNDHLTGGPFGDNLDGGSGDDVLDGGGGNDLLAGGAGRDQLNGGDGDDVLSGQGEDDALNGNGGNDTLNGGTGSDSLKGGDGDDGLHGDDGTDALDGEAGADSLFGGAGDDVEHGGEGNDALDGGSARGCIESAGGDQVFGEGGDDALCGGAGPSAGNDNDVIGGGPGEDTVFYVRVASVAVSLDDAVGDGEAGESDNVASDVEDATTGSGNDTLTGNDGRNVLDGGAGADSLSGLGGNDVLMDSGGDSAADRQDGGAGDDLMAAGAGPDVYVGGDGEDGVTDYAGRSSSVTVTLDGAANDGGSGEGDNVSSDVEDVTGGSAADTLTGNSGDNELVGGAGDDTIAGGDGNDGLTGGGGRDNLDGGAGRDNLDGGAGADTLKTQDGLTDSANCGGGTDSAQVDARDDTAGNCENVSVAKPAPVTIASVTVTRAGFVVVRILCPVVEQVCSGQIFVKTVRRLGGRIITVGRASYRLRGGLAKVLRIRIAAKDRRPLRRARRVKVRALVTNSNGATGDTTGATKLTTVTTRGLR
jgi:Ca2+-binding RTX toxin-like protein